jgi:CBS domain-containing protein
MIARDVMTPDPIRFPPTTPISVVASTFAERGISGAPVVDGAGQLLGMVTEGDLLRRLAAPADEPRSWVATLFETASAQAKRFARTHGRTAADVMTRGMVTAGPDAPIAEVAHLMEDRQIRRVPIVEDGKLLGIVSRADLIRALMQPAEMLAADATDERIRQDVLRAMREQPWIDAFFIFPDVKDGVVLFHGYCRNDEVKRALHVLAEQVAGVKGVQVMVERMPLPIAIP